MNLGVYNPKQLQEFISLLDTARNAGVTEISTIRQAVADEVSRQIEEIKQLYDNPAPPPDFGTCPDCGTDLRPVANPDGLKIVGCRKCRYSKMVTE